MAILDIVLYGSPVLRLKTKSVGRITKEIRELVQNMVDTMVEADGIGLAAPQVGRTISLCIVNNGLIQEGAEPQAYINPVIYETGGELVKMEEGCLSIPDVREEVDRPNTIRVRYVDIEGKKRDEELSGMLSRVLQHEIDHLNGVLFVDRISPMKRKLLSKRLRKIAERS